MLLLNVAIELSNISIYVSVIKNALSRYFGVPYLLLQNRFEAQFIYPSIAVSLALVLAHTLVEEVNTSIY